MSNHRNAVLGLLGIERWVENGSSVAPVMAAPVARLAEPVPASPQPKVEPMPITASPLVPSTDWPTLRAQIAGCTQCKLCKTRSNTVFGVGNPQASLMVVGEGPGADEDASGEPFVGRAGKLLDEMLKAINRNRAVAAETPLVNAATLSAAASESVFIANVVKCRPPGNRDPEKDEVDACRGYLDAQIAHVRPKMIVALGRIAAQRLLGNDEPLSRLRGPIHHYGALKTPVFVTYHPAYLLRSPKEKAKSWEDLKKIAQFLKAHA